MTQAKKTGGQASKRRRLAADRWQWRQMVLQRRRAGARGYNGGKRTRGEGGWAGGRICRWTGEVGSSKKEVRLSHGALQFAGTVLEIRSTGHLNRSSGNGEL